MKKIISLILCIITVFTLIPFANAAFEGEDKIVIVLDPGHGGANVGTAKNGVGEKTLTFRLANMIKERLEANGSFTVHMTRDGDYDLPLASRGIYANTVNADVLVSLHFDGSTSSLDRGVSVITSVLPEYEMSALAQSICSSLSAKTGLSVKGVIRRNDNEGYYWNAEKQWDCQDPSLGTLSDYYGIPTWCSKFGIGSVLIEHGFFTNAGDASIIFAEGTLDKMADADAEAIINYYTNHTHMYESEATQDFPSNCMFTGKQSQKCSVCKHRKNITELESAPDNHYWINESSQQPTCGVDGYVSKECRITLNLNEKDVPCEDHTVKEYIPAQPHEYILSDEKETTHAEDGYRQFTCTKCGHSFKDMYPAEGHSWELTEEIEPNCTEPGKRVYFCSVCESTHTEELAALGHSNVLLDSEEATCTQDGLKKYECTACALVTDEVIAATGHTNTETVISVQSCTEDGCVQTVCSVCNIGETVVKEKLGHDLVLLEEKTPTCEAAGSASYGCSRCDYTENKELEATGHAFESEITAEASFFSRGIKVATCENCKEQYSETIPSGWDSPISKLTVVVCLFFVCTLVSVLFILICKKKKNNSNTETKEPAAEKAFTEEEAEKEEDAAKDDADSERSEETAEHETAAEAEKTTEAEQAKEETPAG